MVLPGHMTAASLEAVREAIRPGVTTLELDRIAQATIRGMGGAPNFVLEPGYHHTLCVSVNDQVVHGVPGPRVLQAGDIVSVDSGAVAGGWNGDAAITVVLDDPARPELVGIPSRTRRDDRARAVGRDRGARVRAATSTRSARRSRMRSRRAPRRSAGASASSRTTSATASVVRCTRNRRCSTTACAATVLR